ncbi:general substrate transporter [Plenodomus tracheiphilus IPT5]|uniref:General substrate transporter n=1 Tax=Plenodomus tracheiphilus IPT5 TaxID=1408161 RepID=A0A6A7B8I6_9PLEO|nr:general substrate transporter [Plenodomus tracheiphilus IPT5]
MASLQHSTLWSDLKCLLICSAVAIASMQYGIDTAAVGGLQAMPGFLMVFGYKDPTSPLGYGIDSTVQQLMTSLMNLGACLSAIAAGAFGSYFGRRPALWLACVVCLVAVALQIGSTAKAGLYIGRLLLGFSNGFFVVFSTIYCSEAAPAHLREIMVGLFSFYVNLGSIIGSVVDNYTKAYMSKLSYRIPLACMFIVPVLLAMALLFVPESPRWLLHHDHPDAARQSLERLRSEHGNTIELEWAEMVRGVTEEKRVAQNTPILDMFRGHDLRRTLLCYGVIASQSASGVWFFIGYQTYFLTLAGITKAFEYTIMNSCIGFVGVHVGLFALKNVCGRRTVVIVGAITCGLCELACGIASSVEPGSKATGTVLVAFTALFMFCYNAGVGAASSPLATEMVSSRLRAWTVGSANALGYFLAWLVGFCSPYFINPQDLDWGPRYAYIWAGSNFICVLWFYFFLPETKARSLEELDELFEAAIAAQKFKGYHCRIVQDAKRDVYQAEEIVRTKADV